ncbi:MAG: hypothetical protein ABI557_07735 [Aureliella sp.]
MRQLTAVSLIAALCVGCSSSFGPPPVPVGGSVTLNGKPVDGALVTFLTKDGVGRSASGKTSADGSFKLTSVNTNDGAAPGEYTITISKQELKGGGGAVDISKDGYGADYGAAMAAAGKGDLGKLYKDLIPKKYADPGQSGLTRTVVKGDANSFTFEL